VKLYFCSQMSKKNNSTKQRTKHKTQHHNKKATAQNSSSGFSVISQSCPTNIYQEKLYHVICCHTNIIHTVLYKRERALELILRLNSVKMRCVKEQEAMQRAPEGRAQQGSPNLRQNEIFNIQMKGTRPHTQWS